MIRRREDGWRGSMTVESAIIMPIFVIIVFSMIMMTKLVYIHAIVQNAIVQTTREISTYSYIVKEVLQLNQIHETIEDVLTGNIDATNLDGKIEDFGQVIDGNIDMIFQIGDEVMDDPVGYAKDTVTGGLSSAALNIYRDLLGEGTGLIASAIFPHYVGQSVEELDYLMNLLGVEGGLKGIRIKGRLPGLGGSVTLDVIAAYKVNLDPPLAYFLNGKTVVQRASCVPWMGKDE